MSDLPEPKQVDVLALHLLSASTEETANLLSSLHKSEKERADRLQEELYQARSDLADVRRLQHMLLTPKYARILIDLLATLDPDPEG